MSEPITSVLHHNSQACVLRKYEALFISLMRDKVLKNGPSKICERQPLKNLMDYDLPSDYTPPNFLKAAFHKFYLVHS